MEGRRPCLASFLKTLLNSRRGLLPLHFLLPVSSQSGREPPKAEIEVLVQTAQSVLVIDG